MTQALTLVTIRAYDTTTNAYNGSEEVVFTERATATAWIASQEVENGKYVLDNRYEYEVEAAECECGQPATVKGETYPWCAECWGEMHAAQPEPEPEEVIVLSGRMVTIEAAPAAPTYDDGYWIIVDGGDYRMGMKRFSLSCDAWEFIDEELAIGLLGYAAARPAYCHPFSGHSNRPLECRHCRSAADAAWHKWTA